MKKSIIIILVIIASLTFLIFFKQNDTIVRVGINAKIMEINTNDKTIVVSYKDEYDDCSLSFKVDCNTAIEKYQIFYCDYETHTMQELSFDSLHIGDKIILSIENNEFLQLNEDSIVQALQIQLATQRLHIE